MAASDTKTAAADSGAAETTAKAAPQVKAAAISETIEVTGPARGRWRACRRFGPNPETIAVADLTAEELAEIEGDPFLRVKRV